MVRMLILLGSAGALVAAGVLAAALARALRQDRGQR